MTIKEQRAVYQRLRKAGKLYGTIRRAMTLSNDRRNRKYTKKHKPLEPIPFGDFEAAVDQMARTERSRLQNWEDAEPDTIHRTIHVEEVDNGKYSGRCTYTHWTYIPRLRCCGICTQEQILWFFGAVRYRLRCPNGWQFGRDNLGLYIVRRTETRRQWRYHFVASELESKTTLRKVAIEHEQRQREAVKLDKQRQRDTVVHQKYIKLAEKVGIYVGVRDSVKSGNCAAGTRQWVQSNGLLARKYYAIDVIRRIAKSGYRLEINRTIEAATYRTIRDLERGYCEIA